jgi:hypothetical protein
LTDEAVQQINQLLSQKISIEKGMTNTQTSFSNILKQRTSFLVAYNNSVAESILSDKMCPLCGRESAELTKLFSETESVLKSNLCLIATQLSDVIKKLTNLFEQFVIQKVNTFLNLHQALMEKNNLLLSFLQVSTVELDEKLKKENIVFSNIVDSVDFNLFEEKYSEIIDKLSARIGEETEVVTDELYAKLLRISLEYYSHIEPCDEHILLKKKFYISALFSNSLNIKLKEAENNHSALDTKIKNLDTIAFLKLFLRL